MSRCAASSRASVRWKRPSPAKRFSGVRLMLRRTLVGLSLVLGCSNAPANELTYFATDALAPAMRQLVPQFEQASGHKSKMTVANAGTIAARLEAAKRFSGVRLMLRRTLVGLSL